MEQQKKFKDLNPLSLTSVKIFPSRKDGELVVPGGHATGFLWLSPDDYVYLITNWHNVTGWDLARGKALSEKAFTPTCVGFELALSRPVGEGLVTRDFRAATLELFDGEGRPTWLEHPEYGSRVDVVALRVAQLGDADLLTKPLNKYDFTDFTISAGDDAYVIGYPLSLTGGPRLPIWKRASIASEPAYDQDGLPKVLIDTATRKGMSGSPVIVVRRGLINPRGTAGLSDQTMIGSAEAFLGVYSGRIDDDLLGAQIGIVWKASVVDEVVTRGKPGSSPFNAAES